MLRARQWFFTIFFTARIFDRVRLGLVLAGETVRGLMQKVGSLVCHFLVQSRQLPLALPAAIASFLLPCKSVLDAPQLFGGAAKALRVRNIFAVVGVSGTEGKLLQVLALAIQAKRILEVGTLGGYSEIHSPAHFAKKGRPCHEWPQGAPTCSLSTPRRRTARAVPTSRWRCAGRDNSSCRSSPASDSPRHP